MSEKKQIPHSLGFSSNILTISGVVQVVAISANEAQFKLSDNVLFVKGTGLNVVKLDREQGTVQLETSYLSAVTYRAGGGLKGLFR